MKKGYSYILSKLKKLDAWFFGNLDTIINVNRFRYLSRWHVFFIDMLLVVLGTLLTLSFLITVNPVLFPNILWGTAISVVSIIYALSFLIVRTHAGIIRHSTFYDLVKVMGACTVGYLVLVVFDGIQAYYLGNNRPAFWVEAALLSVIIFNLLLGFRMAVKLIFRRFLFASTRRNYKRVVILGDDNDAITLGEAIHQNTLQPFELAAFVSFKPNHKHLRILNLPVLYFDHTIFDEIEKLRASGILVLGPDANKLNDNRFADEALKRRLKLYTIKGVEKVMTGNDISRQIREVQIEDLLQRDPINIDSTNIQNDLTGKRILITGAAGSIGSELVRQVLQYNPKEVLLVDQAESPLHNLLQQLRNKYTDLPIQSFIADVTNYTRMEMIFEQYNIHIVYHAAAFKHVPLMEDNPCEAIQVNVHGTMHVAKLAVLHNVGKFVMVSTDKAVNPTNVMGATKQAAEIYLQNLQEIQRPATRFISTRFGNVLGSNGSVIPRFKEQIAAGGPLTVTHRDIIRYFMTIPEAVQLVLQAGTMGKGGETFVFDMGEPVKIAALARRMIRLSGLRPDEDIKIEFTGLRPGEKLYEELLSDKAKTQPTYHEKIMIAVEEQEITPDYESQFKALVEACCHKNEYESVQLLKGLVPTFKSENSRFEILDTL